MTRMFRLLKADEIECMCSTDGTVMHTNGNAIPQRTTRNGYKVVSMRTKSGPKTWFVHRLIAQCFLPNPEMKPCVNHKDGNKQNNSVENLEWCTYSENEFHSYRVLGKSVPKEHLIKMWAIHSENVSKAVRQVDDEGNVVEVFKSQADASRRTGISQGNISECCNGKRKHAGGYLWEECSGC